MSKQLNKRVNFLILLGNHIFHRQNLFLLSLSVIKCIYLLLKLILFLLVWTFIHFFSQIFYFLLGVLNVFIYFLNLRISSLYWLLLQWFLRIRRFWEVILYFLSSWSFPQKFLLGLSFENIYALLKITNIVLVINWCF